MKKRLTALVLGLWTALSMTACGATGKPSQKDVDISPELTYDRAMELKYAEQFSVDRYEGGYALITVDEGGRFLVIPEGKTAPSQLDDDIVPLRQPIGNIYLAASAAMDMFLSMGALEDVGFSALKADGWYVDEVKEAMAEGEIQYAGKYSAPDYELILTGNCGLAVENTMIYHTPEVKEQLERFGVPVFVDYSSYEKNPLGRTEWVKVYGLLTGHEEEAQAAFDREAKAFEAISGQEKTGKTVAFFYITANGEANVRKSSDYLPKMIEMAGGEYVFQDLGDADSPSSTMLMQMEEFYAGARDADVIIYNSAVDSQLSSVEELLGKSPLLANFKAVQEGNVYCTTKNLYQSSMSLGTITADIHGALTGDVDGLTFLYRLE